MKFSAIPNYLVFICLYVVLIYRYLLMFDRDAVLLTLRMGGAIRFKSGPYRHRPGYPEFA